MQGNCPDAQTLPLMIDAESRPVFPLWLNRWEKGELRVLAVRLWPCVIIPPLFERLTLRSSPRGFNGSHGFTRLRNQSQIRVGGLAGEAGVCAGSGHDRAGGGSRSRAPEGSGHPVHLQSHGVVLLG